MLHRKGGPSSLPPPPKAKSERRSHKSRIRAARHALRDKAAAEGGLGSFPIVYHINLVAGMGSKLLGFLVRGTWTWVYMLGRLMLFVVVLLPGFLVMALYYARHPVRNVRYHSGPGRPSSRHLLDVYLPVAKGGEEGEDVGTGKAPVLVFLTGGAWIIGYKMWGALLGRALCPHGVMVVIPDYRNFPQADVTKMMGDVDMAIQWVRDNVDAFGGDRDNITLVGQSAGAHLGSMVLLTKAAAACRAESLSMLNKFSFATVDEGVDFDLAIHQGLTDPGADADADAEVDADDGGDQGEAEAKCWEKERAASIIPSHKRVRGFTTQGPDQWKPTDLRGFIPISGPYDLVYLSDHFQSRGLDKRILEWIFQKAFEKYSPTILARNLSESSIDLGRYFPPTCVIHGANDVSAPCEGGVQFHAALAQLGVDAELVVYPSMTHTDPILEKPFAGDQQLHRDIYERLRKWGRKGAGAHRFVEFDDRMGCCRRVAPQLMIDVARMANPF